MEVVFEQNIKQFNVTFQQENNSFDVEIVQEQHSFNVVLSPLGEKGLKGDKGDVGLKGDTGQNGKSAYQSAVENGYTGTEQDWINDLLPQDIDGGVIF